jgi:hypothetical protein
MAIWAFAAVAWVESVPIAMQAATDRTIRICRLMDLMGDSFAQCEGMIARDEKDFMTGEGGRAIVARLRSFAAFGRRPRYADASGRLAPPIFRNADWSPMRPFSHFRRSRKFNNRLTLTNFSAY